MTEYIDDYKIILIGNECVGKTCLFKKLFLGEFKEKYTRSIGLDKRIYKFKINIDNKGINEEKNLGIKLYDSPGELRFLKILNRNIKGTNATIILYDITNRKSFDDIENLINVIKENNPTINGNINYVIFLVGNKLDLIDDGDNKRQVTEEEAKILCEKHNIVWGGEKSIKNMDKNELEEMMKEFIKEIYNKIGEIKIIAHRPPISFHFTRPHHQIIPKCVIF